MKLSAHNDKFVHVVNLECTTEWQAHENIYLPERILTTNFPDLKRESNRADPIPTQPSNFEPKSRHCRQKSSYPSTKAVV
jgi:hypothetical protein